MKLTTTYPGEDDPFEGDRTLWLRNLPAGAQVTKATVTLAPASGTLFEENINFTDSQDDLGATKAKGTGFVEVDFHARRTLAAVEGTNLTGANLQVDIGGTYVEINARGAVKTPDDGLFSLPADHKLPGLTVNKFKLSRASGTLDVTNVTIRSVPTNVSARLGQMPPFWMRLGELATPETSPDFAAVLNAFLAEATVENGFYAIPFVVHSDTIARLDVELAIDYAIQQPILPPYLPEVTLPYGYSSLPGVGEDLLIVELPREAKPLAGTGGAAQGTFDASRVVFGEIGESGATATIAVSPGRALAQPIQLAAETPVSGIDLPLANTEPGLAGLHLALQADADGKPSGEVLTSAGVSVEKPVPGGSAWGSAALPAEFRFLPDERYWLVLQSVSGEAYWDVRPGDPATPALQVSTDGGLSWRTAATEAGEKPLAGLFRLRHIPERFSVPLQLQVGTGPDAVRVRFDRFAPLGRVEFDLNFATELGDYLASPAAASPCGAGELLTNGSFDQPPHDDATRRLFGFDDGDGTTLVGTVDLSRGVDLRVERFITLSVNDDLKRRRIDCAGSDPARTSLVEIISTINRAAGAEVADRTNGDDGGPYLKIASTATCRSGSVHLHPWLRAAVPQGWQRPAEAEGQIWRFKLPTAHPPGSDTLQPERVVAILEATEAEPAMLSQRVPVAGGCAYVLRFLFWYLQAAKVLHTSSAALLSALPAVQDVRRRATPSWEVRWLDAEGQLINSKGEELDALGQFPRVEGMFEGEVRMVAPSGAVQAEIRFIQPSLGLLSLDDVSFVPTREALVNSSLGLWRVDPDSRLPERIRIAEWCASVLDPQPVLLGWTHVSGWVDPAYDPNSRRLATVLRGGGPEDAILSQTTEIVAGERYELQVRARPVPPPAGAVESRPFEQRARLELRWLADDDEVGEPLILPLDGRDFPTQAWAGSAPDGATQAETRLVQPQGRGNLLVESVSLAQVDLVSVPLTFLAETPGELTVSDLCVTFELPEPPPPPTPLERVAAAAVPPPPRPALASSPINVVAGVGDRFSAILSGLATPITTLAELAALDPETEIEGISRDRRLELKTAAEMIMAIRTVPISFSALADESLETLLFASPDDLVTRSGRPRAEVDTLQRDLRALRLLLKNEAFRSLRLSALITGGG